MLSSLRVFHQSKHRGAPPCNDYEEWDAREALGDIDCVCCDCNHIWSVAGFIYDYTRAEE